MKKTCFALILALSLITSCFAGCTGSTAAPSAVSTPSGSASTTPGSAPTGTSEPAIDTEPVTIQYWQYVYESKVNLITELIKEFEQANPNITIEHVNYPFDSYYEKLAASIVSAQNSGVGPNIFNYNSTMITDYYSQGVVQPLPTDVFNPDEIEREYSSLVQAGKFEGAYYAMPVAVRTYALFYNKNLLEQAGYTVDDLPKTWQEFADMAERMTVWENGELKIAGTTMDKESRLLHWVRIVMKNLGGDLYSDDFKTAQYNSPQALQALEYMIDLYKNRKVSVSGFVTIDHTAFSTGVAAFHIDGSYRSATFKSKIGDTFEWGVAELPVYAGGTPASYSDYWCNSISSFTQGKQLDASVKFLEFISGDEIMKRWTIATGEIGAKTSLINDPELLADEYLAPFIKGLPYAFTTFSIKEYRVDDAWREIFETCLLGDGDPKATLDNVNTKMQAALDEFWADFA